MKTINIKTQFDLIQKGYKILAREMGPTDSIRFIMSFNSGSDDSLKLKKKLWNNKSIEEISKIINTK